MRSGSRALPPRILAGVVLFQAIFALPLSAQNPRGSLFGAVVDSTGGRIADARVELRQPDSGFGREATSNNVGEFQFQSLLLGRYRVRATAPGFATAEVEVMVAVSSAPTISLTLVPTSLQQTVEVRGGRPPATEALETTRSVQKTVITNRELEEVPLALRSFANIAYLAPMTEPVEPSDPTKARITAVSFAGSSGLNVEASVDGGDNNDDWIGGFLQNYSPEAIQEFAVRTAQFDADTSRTNGGSVIISTRRGTNDWHGSASLFVRNTALDARNTLDNPEPSPKQPYAREDGVVTLGGPIRRDKLWLFSSLEYVNEDASVAYSNPSLTQFNALAQLAAMGLIPKINSIGAPTAVPVPFRDALSDTRLDWAQSPRSQWFMRGSLDRYHTDNDLLTQGALPSTGATTRSDYFSVLFGNQFQFGSAWLGNLILQANGFDLSRILNANLGFALAFPFTATFLATSGFETFGDNQFNTSNAAFPIQRNQEKYQLRYDVTHSMGRHMPRFGVNLIHEPVLEGALVSTAEHLVVFAENPSFYLQKPPQFVADFSCQSNATPGTKCLDTQPSNGGFSQNVQRLGAYAEDSWRIRPSLTLNYSVRYDTTFGLFQAEGRDQSQNPALLALERLSISLVRGIPHDYRKAVAPRLGIAYAPRGSSRTVIRAGFGLFYNDLGQNGWVNAFQAVNSLPAPLPGAGEAGALIDPHYRAPYALQASAGAEHVFADGWILNVHYEHQQGNHEYRRYEYVAGFTLPADAPNVSLFRSDNRSSYNGLALQVRRRFLRRFELIANYTLAKATTWGATAGELFDYVNGVSNVNNPFGPGDHGPSGEDVRHRLVVAGVLNLPGGLEASTLSQFETARPYTMFTPVDVNGDGVTTNDRAIVNGVQTTLDEFRGKPFLQVDLRVGRPIRFGERATFLPFAEFFNLFDRANAGNNFIPDLAALPTPVNNLSNATAFCLNPPCTQTQPITSLKQLRVPAGALGDLFGPGTTVGVPFTAQLGFRLSF